MANAIGLNTDAPLEGTPHGNDRHRVSEATLARLAAYLGYDTNWPEWTDGTAEEFADRYNQEARSKQESAPTPAIPKRLTDARLRPGPSESDNLEGKERLASIVLSFMQRPPGEPWPVLLQLRCQNDTIDQFEVAVKRGWLQIEVRNSCTLDVAESRDIQVAGSEGTVKVGAPAGRSYRTSWEVIANGKFIGVIDLPETFCGVGQLSPGDTLTARFAAFVKDLENITANDDAIPENCKSPTDSVSWRRLGYQTLGAAKQAIMMRVAQLNHLPGSERGWVVLCQTRRTFDTDG